MQILPGWQVSAHLKTLLERPIMIWQAGGKQAWLDTCKIPLTDDNNKVFGLLGLYEDVTEKIQAEEELKSAKNYIANIIESMPSAPVGVNIDNHVTQWNSKAEHLTGVAGKTALGKPLIDVFPQMANRLNTITEAVKAKKIKIHRKEAHQLRKGSSKGSDRDRKQLSGYERNDAVKSI